MQRIRCGEISWKIQRKDQILGSLETTYLVKMNKVELISEGHDKKYIYTRKLDNVQLFDMDKYHKRKYFVGECRKMQIKL